jgi:hypothetical protein
MTEIILGNGVTWEMFISFLLLGFFGLMCSVVFDVYSSGIDANEFEFKKFWKRNKIRTILSLLMLVVGILFSEQLLGASLNTWTAFLAGFTSDKLIENLLRRKAKKEIAETTYNG